MLVSLEAVLIGGLGAVIHAGHRSAGLQAASFLGFTGLGLATAVVCLVQARRADALSRLAYLLTTLSAVYANITAFLVLAELTGITEARQAREALWTRLALTRWAAAGVCFGMTLLGVSVLQARVLPPWSGGS